MASWCSVQGRSLVVKQWQCIVELPNAMCHQNPSDLRCQLA
jgi:hypothetical protein